MGNFSDRLAGLRGKQQMNKAEFSRFLGLSPPVYQRYEAGRVPAADHLSVIADRCGVTVDWLLGRDSSPPPSASSAPPRESIICPPAADPSPTPAGADARLAAMEARLAAMEARLAAIETLLVRLLAQQDKTEH
jgi:transcriptional regulator with XRE-family HTH domain